MNAADEAVRLAETAPERSRALALSVLDEDGCEDASRARAAHALAVACMQVGKLPEARRWVAAGIEVASAAGLDLELAELQATSALLWFHAEAPGRALREIEEALSGATAAAAATLLGQRAHLMFRLGRHEEGLTSTEAALGALTEAEDEERAAGGTKRGGRPAETITARIVSNRGLARCYRGEHEDAVADLERALALHRVAGADALAAQSLHNLAFATGRIGDVPRALRLFDETAAEYARVGLPTYQLDADRAALLTAASLLPEARQALSACAEGLADAGLHFDAAEAQLALAEACLADHDHGAAIEIAGLAEEAFLRQGRRAWVVRAEEVRERSGRMGLSAREEWVEVATSAASSARRLRDAGWRGDALEVAVSAAQAARHANRDDLVRDVLDSYAPPAPGAGDGDGDGGGTDGDPVSLHADALRSLAGGRRDVALRSLRLGLDLATLRAGRIRAATGRSGHGAAAASLAETGLSEALASGSPAEVLEWAELRRIAVRGRQGSSPPPPGDAPTVAGRGDGCLVEFVSHRRSLSAVVAGRDLRLVDLGSLAGIEKARASLHFAISRLVSADPVSSRGVDQAAMVSLLHRSARELDERLYVPLGALVADTTGEREGGPECPRLTLVPSGVLHDVPWGLLPSFRRHRLSVVASAWVRASDPPETADARSRPGAVLLVAGPGLAAAAVEIGQLAASWRGLRGTTVHVLEGERATCDRVLRALEECDLAHLAVHGRFRADNPHMSSLRLADGDLTVHELGRLSRTPASMVLSACDAARVAVHPGEEVAGPLPALLECGGGVTSQAYAIASVGPLADSVMPVVSAVLHRHLMAGESPPEALAETRAELADPLSDEDGRVDKAALAAACLVCHSRRAPIDVLAHLPGATRPGLGECPP